MNVPVSVVARPGPPNDPIGLQRCHPPLRHPTASWNGSSAPRPLCARSDWASGPHGGIHLQMVPLSLGESTPDAVRLVHIDRVLTAGHHRGAVQADGLRVRFAAGSGRTAFAFGVEEEGTGHSATCGIELPVPAVGVRSRKSSRVCHLFHSSGHRTRQGAAGSAHDAHLQRHAGASPDVVVLLTEMVRSGPPPLLERSAAQTLESCDPRYKTKIKSIFRASPWDPPQFTASPADARLNRSVLRFHRVPATTFRTRSPAPDRNATGGRSGCVVPSVQGGDSRRHRRLFRATDGARSGVPCEAQFRIPGARAPRPAESPLEHSESRLQ